MQHGALVQPETSQRAQGTVDRLWAVVWVIVLAPQLESRYGGNEQLLVEAVAGITTWTGWVIPLLISQWWLERRRQPAVPDPVPTAAGQA